MNKRANEKTEKLLLCKAPVCTSCGRSLKIPYLSTRAVIEGNFWGLDPPSLPRNALNSVDFAVTRCLSVRLSVTHWYSVEITNHILKLFSPSDSHLILVFRYQMACQHSDGDPSNENVNRNFRPISRFVSEIIQDKRHSYYETLIGTCMWSIEWCYFQWPWTTPN